MSASTASRDEAMAYAASLEIKDGEVAFIGTGLPMVAAYLAKLTHAPRVSLVFESGIIDPEPVDLATSVGDYRLVHGATKLASTWYALSLLQGGRIDVGFLGAAEIDRYVNINSTVIGPYDRPQVRLPGSGGANDIASMAGRFVIIGRHDRRRLVERLSYVTTPGFLDSPGARQRAGLPGGGPVRIITDLAIMGFDPLTRVVRVDALFPGVTPADVRERTGFAIEIADDAGAAPAPGDAYIRLMREVIDPDEIYIRRPGSGGH